MIKQQELIKRIIEILKQDTAIESAWLCGSFGRGDADNYSDIDVLLLVSEEKIDTVFSSLLDKAARIDTVLYSKKLAHSRTLNVITRDWLRYDLTLMTLEQMQKSQLGRLRPLFGEVAPQGLDIDKKSSITPETVQDIANEFIRVLGLMPVAIGRNELVVAQTGTNILRELLIRLMVHENDPQPARGALSLSKSLTTEQISRLVSLPAVSARKGHIRAANKFIAETFLPLGRKMVRKTGATWPEDFEKATLQYLERELGLRIFYEDKP